LETATPRSALSMRSPPRCEPDFEIKEPVVRPIIAMAGAIAQRPGHGGHAWVFLQYLLGFQRLGYEVLFLDRLEPDACTDAAGVPCRFEDSENRRYLLEVMQQLDLLPSFSLDYNRGEATLGLSRRNVLERLRHAPLINVMGYLQDEELLAAAGRRIFLDIDPGFGQMWQALDLARMFDGHDAHVTIGLNIGRPVCTIPTCGLRWITTPQPIVLSRWPPQMPLPAGRFSSIVSWRGPFGPVEFEGQTYGLRVHEFRKFLELPGQSGLQFELVLDIDSADTADRERLSGNGWSLLNPRSVAKDPAAYRQYIQNAWAEFMVAKQMYVKSNSGWISDRSICYLASGKPVLAQDTYLQDQMPCGKGLLLFSTPAEAVAGAREIAGNYPQHAKAARRLAEEVFDSDIVLRQLLTKLRID
jgi:hypothetical protein